MSQPPRVILVSNRLPFVVRAGRDGVTLTPSSGGLATGLRGVHAEGDSIWVGWPGETAAVGRRDRARVTRTLLEQRVVPVHLERSEIKSYYDGVCNGVIWPLFHYQSDRLPLGSAAWDVYRSVNERFAATVVREYRAGDLIWIHDYHLLLVPELVRRALPEAAIGFFLHIPFPAAELFRILPWRREIVSGMLGASVLGFHTVTYASHFREAARSLGGAEGHRVIGAYPMGVDAARFSRMADDPDVRRERAALTDRPNQRLLLGIDRLDYTKGIPRRLLAYERLLRDNPGLRGHVRLIQVAVPSREGVPSYQRFRQEIDELVGRINGEHGTVDWTPIRYLHQSVSPAQLVALYGAADVMLVTPLRDGMNLVAKEFVAARADGDGVLVLSEFAGAASQLPEAMPVNPYSIEELAAAMHAALSMDPAERRRRMARLRERVAAQDIDWWSDRFLGDLAAHAASAAAVPRLAGVTPFAIPGRYQADVAPLALPAAGERRRPARSWRYES